MGGGGGDEQFSDSPQSNSRRCGAPMLEGSAGSVGASSPWREEEEATLRRGRWAGLTLGGTWGKCRGIWGECPDSDRTGIGLWL